ncbi:MAG: hypothetical protein WCC21_13890 [Candidatus Acidiferrales bacterium]
MGAMSCNEFHNQLEGWMEDERGQEARAHLASCASCRALVADLDAIQQRAHAWGADEVSPPERVWVSLRAQLEAEGMIRGDAAGEVAREAAKPKHGWFAGILDAVPRPVLAGAYLAALIGASIALTGQSTRQLDEARWMNGTQNTTGALSADLQNAERDTVSAMSQSDPVVTASLHDNLAIVDNYIALCEKSVREDPENEIARDYLYEAYEQKADLLAQMTERGVSGR